MSKYIHDGQAPSASWEDCSSSRNEKHKSSILGENSVKRDENFMDDLVMHALLENLLLKDSLNAKRDHLRNKKLNIDRSKQ
ncbi:hypothetical protein M514_03685 [Trichuris suis]|uniref:Uncharacterized protein n=1 Tax=Trichuris suis TaxID=68888 RepID=A0A085MDP9_9BILA|nr:hypothetical protein M513_03685 [Trichuris suis]KFD68669.1 hypothetical protein M514_03685 [Trichuris suis]